MPKRRPKGEGSYEELRSGSLRAYAPGANGKKGPRKTFPPGPTRDEDARRWVARQIAAGGRAAAAGTLGDWLTTWLELQAARVSAASFAADRQTIEKHVRPLGKTRLSQLDALTVERWLARLKAAGVTQCERHKAGKCLRKCLTLAVQYGSLPANPFGRGGARVPPAPKTRARAMTYEETGRLLAAADRLGWGVYCRVGLELGLRPSELLALRWEDFDPARREISVVRSLEIVSTAEVPPKTARAGPLPLSRRTAAALDERRAGRTEGVMFPAPRGRYWMAKHFRPRVWAKITAAAGFAEVPPRNILRHTCASVLLSRGESILVVARRLGHSNPATTLKIYAHMMPGDQERAAAVWGDVLDEISAKSQSHASPTAAENPAETQGN